MIKIIMALILGWIIVHYELWENVFYIAIYIIIGLFLMFMYNLLKDLIKDINL